MPQLGDKLYRVWNDRLDVVTFVREEILPGAGLPTYVVDYFDGRRANTAPEMYELTELAAWQRYLHEAATGVEACRAQVNQAHAHFRQARQSRVLANRQVRLLTGRPVRVLPGLSPPSVITAETAVAYLPVSMRCRKRLSRGGIQTVGQLCQWSANDLLDGRRGVKDCARNFGQTSLAELERVLATYGFHLATEDYQHVRSHPVPDVPSLA